MSELRELYQEVILDHSRRPRNFRTIDAPSHEAHGTNPLCGDRLTVSLSIDGDVIQDIAFQGAGCAIATASASMMTEAVKGREVADARALFDVFHELLTGRGPTKPVGKLAAFAGVKEFPVRVKCATLAWHTLKAALDRASTPASTE